MSWDAGLADKAQIPIAELRAYEAIFKQLDPQGEGEINVTKCDNLTNLDVVVIAVGSGQLDRSSQTMQAFWDWDELPGQIRITVRIIGHGELRFANGWTKRLSRISMIGRGG